MALKCLIVAMDMSSNPSSPSTGEAYYDTTDNYFKVYDGSAWTCYCCLTSAGAGICAPSYGGIHGGTKTSGGGFTCHTFTSTGWLFNYDGTDKTGVSIEILGGGGGGGNYSGGGGGGGAVCFHTNQTISAGACCCMEVAAGGPGGCPYFYVPTMADPPDGARPFTPTYAGAQGDRGCAHGLNLVGKSGGGGGGWLCGLCHQTDPANNPGTYTLETPQMCGLGGGGGGANYGLGYNPAGDGTNTSGPQHRSRTGGIDGSGGGGTAGGNGWGLGPLGIGQSSGGGGTGSGGAAGDRACCINSGFIPYSNNPFVPQPVPFDKNPGCPGNGADGPTWPSVGYAVGGGGGGATLTLDGYHWCSLPGTDRGPGGLGGYGGSGGGGRGGRGMAGLCPAVPYVIPWTGLDGACNGSNGEVNKGGGGGGGGTHAGPTCPASCSWSGNGGSGLIFVKYTT